MEIRAGKVIFSSSGGTAEKNSVSCKISLPTAWIKALGFDKDDREAELHFDGHTISICKKQTADSYIALHKQSGHTLRKYSFYDSNELCTVIYADHTDKTVFAENFTDDLVKTAFGKKQFPRGTIFVHLLKNGVSLQEEAVCVNILNVSVWTNTIHLK